VSDRRDRSTVDDVLSAGDERSATQGPFWDLPTENFKRGERNAQEIAYSSGRLKFNRGGGEGGDSQELSSPE
jgi:hypothetical protein